MKYTTKANIKLVLKINNAKNRASQRFKLGISQSTYYHWLKKLNEAETISNKSTRPHHSPHLLRNIKIIKIIKDLYLKARGKYYI